MAVRKSGAADWAVQMAKHAMRHHATHVTVDFKATFRSTRGHVVAAPATYGLHATAGS